jgi:hypothetical protein
MYMTTSNRSLFHAYPNGYEQTVNGARMLLGLLEGSLILDVLMLVPLDVICL